LSFRAEFIGRELRDVGRVRLNLAHNKVSNFIVTLVRDWPLPPLEDNE
jgi:hypothetical protein